jgi:hypothetical protein
MIRFSFALAVVTLTAFPLMAQEAFVPATPGPEHKHLQAFEGAWDAKMKMAGASEAMDAVATYKTELGGLWVSSEFKCDSPAFKFTGKGLDGYDTNKKKFVSTWADSISTALLVMEGTRDEKTQTTTMTGQGYEAGKPVKFKAVTKEIDADHFTFQMLMVGDDGKETPAFTIEYARKK